MPTSKHWKILFEGALFAVLYYGLAQLGFSFATFHRSASPVWPATGFAIAYLIRRGPSRTPFVALAAAVANLHTGANEFAVLGISLGNALEAWLGRRLYLWTRRRRSLGQQREVTSLVNSAVFASLTSASIGVASLWITGALTTNAIQTTWFTWWVGDCLGALTVVPAALSLTSKRLRSRWMRFDLGRIVATLLLLAAGSMLLVGRVPAPAHFGVLFVLLAGLRFVGSEVLKLLSLAFSAVAFYGTVRGTGPFQLGTLNENLIHLQLFLATVTITASALIGFRRVGTWLPYVLLIVGWGFSAYLFASFRRAETVRDRNQLEVLVRDAENALRQRMNSYVDSLRGGVSLVTTRQVTYGEWKDYVTNLRVAERYPGLRGIGIIYPVAPREVPAFERKRARERQRDFRVHPATGRRSVDDDRAYVISYIEPFELNRLVEGFDIGSEKLRRKAADLARDTGKPAIASRIQLVQDARRTPGFLLLLPFYGAGAKLDTVQDRQQHHRGWVYAPIVADEFLWKAYDFGNGLLEIAIYEEGDASENFVFRSGEGKMDPEFETGLTFENHSFRALWRRGPRFVSNHDTTSSWIGVGGVLLTLLLASLVLTLQSFGERARVLADRQTQLLRDSRERFALAVQGSSDGIWDWNVLTNEVFYSTRWKAQLGYADNEVETSFEAFERLLHPDDKNVVQEAVRAHFDRRVPYAPEFRMRAKNGDYRWILARGQAIWDETGRPTRMAGSHTDITDARRFVSELTQAKEAALAATEAKSSFLANMSHEVRTPAAGVVGLMNLLLDTPLNAEQRQYAEAIQRSGDGLLAVLNDILDFSKIEANKLEIERASFDLRRLVTDLESSTGMPAIKRGLEIRVHVDPDVPQYVIGDPGRVRQVLLNLLSNAIKFTYEGSVRLTVSVEKAPEGEHIRFTVKDSGIGIPAYAQEKLFHAFTQADSSTSRKFGGSGLGLSICKRLVDLMRGRIGVESEVGIGSTFWFSIPAEEDMARSLEPNPASHVAFSHLRVLIAEDNPVNQMVIVGNLEKLGCRIHVVANGENALRALENDSFDIVLMDLQMPQVDGYEATRHIRRHASPRISSVPIVAVTANALKSDRDFCLSIGMNDYLTKPLRISELTDAILRCVPTLATRMHSTPEEDPDLFTDLAEIYLRETPSSIERMKESLRARDFSAVRVEAHGLKSGSAYLQLHALSEAALALENAHDSDALNVYAQAIETIERLYANARSDLERVLAQRTRNKRAA